MAKDIIFDRLLCMEAGLEYRKLFDSQVGTELAQFREASCRLKGEIIPRLRVLEDNRQPWSSKRLIQTINELHSASGTSQLLIVVDYFQLIHIRQRKGNSVDADHERIKLLLEVQAATRTRDLPLGDPMLVVSEVRKGETGRIELTMADLMGSARLGSSAHTAMFLEPDERARPEADVVPVQLTIRKGRDGVVRTRIPLLFDHAKSRFRESKQPRQSNAVASQGGTRPPNPDPYAYLK